MYGADWWDWFVRADRLGRVTYGRAYWSTAYVTFSEVLTIGLDGVE